MRREGEIESLGERRTVADGGGELQAETHVEEGLVLEPIIAFRIANRITRQRVQKSRILALLRTPEKRDKTSTRCVIIKT